MAEQKEFYECTVCGVKARDECVFGDHIRGKGHQQALDRQREAARNVFVRGFPKINVTSDLLIGLFEQYGKVENLILKDLFAIVTFTSETSANEALQHPPSLEGKTLIVKPRDYKLVHKADKPKHVAMDTTEEEESNLPVSKEALESIKDADNVINQLTLLSQHGALSYTTSSNIITLCDRLYNLFLPLFGPQYKLVPFGSVITEHGTTTSDCDIALLTSLPPDISSEHFRPERYYPQTLQDLASSFPAHFTAPISGHNTCLVKEGSEITAVKNALQKFPGTERVFAIQSARCPIVRFYYRPFKIHVDISVNNILGPLNSRLLRAYSMFDSRVAMVIRVIRMWMRWTTQRKVNSYAVSLMVIYALQHTSPPLLPCLQDVGSWPRNMEYPMLERSNRLTYMYGSWSCDFSRIESLKPTVNTDNIGNLVLYFFKFYSSVYRHDNHVVAIHSSSPLSRDKANQLSTTKCSRRLQLKKCPLVVQDPVDLSHNVTKSVRWPVYTQLRQRLERAVQIMEGELMEFTGGLSKLFDEAEYNKVAVTTSLKPHFAVMNLDLVSSLLARVDHPLLAVLSQLDLTNQITAQSLRWVISHVIVTLMEKHYGFSYDHVTTSDDHVTTSEDYGFSYDHVTTSEDLMIDDEDQNEPVAMETSEADDSLSNELVARKRRRSEDSPIEELKRSKVKDDTTPTPVDILHRSISSIPLTSDYVCAAKQVTWCRASPKDVSITSTGHMLQLHLFVHCPSHDDVVMVTKKDSICVVMVTPASEEYKTQCDFWWSVFKSRVFVPRSE